MKSYKVEGWAISKNLNDNIYAYLVDETGNCFIADVTFNNLRPVQFANNSGSIKIPIINIEENSVSTDNAQELRKDYF